MVAGVKSLAGSWRRRCDGRHGVDAAVAVQMCEPVRPILVPGGAASWDYNESTTAETYDGPRLHRRREPPSLPTCRPALGSRRQ